MQELINIIHRDIDHAQLKNEISSLLGDHDLNQPQVSLTSVSGDDWHSGNGKIQDLEYPERFYGTINQSLRGTYIHELINRYPKFYRWRLLKLSGRTTYSVHPDGSPGQNNYRLHIPVITNPGCFMAFYEHMPAHSIAQQVYHYHFTPGNSYEVNTTHLHTAVNYGTTDRYHIVGVRYESSRDRP